MKEKGYNVMWKGFVSGKSEAVMSQTFQMATDSREV